MLWVCSVFFETFYRSIIFFLWNFSHSSLIFGEKNCCFQFRLARSVAASFMNVVTLNNNNKFATHIFAHLVNSIPTKKKNYETIPLIILEHAMLHIFKPSKNHYILDRYSYAFCCHYQFSFFFEHFYELKIDLQAKCWERAQTHTKTKSSVSSSHFCFGNASEMNKGKYSIS